jgi:RimJ/RimL family protein N-acetyltransferase
MLNNDWILRDIDDEDDYYFLYELLKQRNDTINISHKETPTYEQHCNFVKSKPYPYYKLIGDIDNRIGVCYVTEKNEIGIFIDKKYQGQGYGKAVLRRIIEINAFRKKFHVLYANINPRNLKSQNLFKDLGFKLIQQTYALMPTCAVENQ